MPEIGNQETKNSNKNDFKNIAGLNNYRFKKYVL